MNTEQLNYLQQLAEGDIFTAQVPHLRYHEALLEKRQPVRRIRLALCRHSAEELATLFLLIAAMTLLYVAFWLGCVVSIIYLLLDLDSRLENRAWRRAAATLTTKDCLCLAKAVKTASEKAGGLKLIDFSMALDNAAVGLLVTDRKRKRQATRFLLGASTTTGSLRQMAFDRLVEQIQESAPQPPEIGPDEARKIYQEL